MRPFHANKGQVMSTTFPLKSQLLRAFASVGALTVILGGVFIPTHQALADDESPRISLGAVEGRVGKAVFNDFDDDHTSMKLKKEWVHTVNDPGSRYHGRTIRIGSVTTAWYGVIPGVSDYNASDSRQVSVPWSAGYTPKWIDTSTAAAGYWSYVTRGVPEDTTQTRYKWYQPDGPTNIEVKDTSAIGFRPNDPGQVTAGTPFLLGTVRHNNFPIRWGGKWVHSSIDLRLGGKEFSFPFDQMETTNDAFPTARPRQGGAYTYAGAAFGTDKKQCWKNYQDPVTGQYVNSYPAKRRDDTRDPNQIPYDCYWYKGEGNGNFDIYARPSEVSEFNYPVVTDSANQTPESDDTLFIRKTVSDATIERDGMRYHLVLHGFTQTADGQCPAVPSGDFKDTFRSKEGKSSFGCLYGEFQQERYLRFVKQADAPQALRDQAEPIPSARLLSQGGDLSAQVSAKQTPSITTLNGTAVAPAFLKAGEVEQDGALAPTGWGATGQSTNGRYHAFLTGSSDVKVHEATPPQGWSLRDMTCTDGTGKTLTIDKLPASTINGTSTAGGLDLSSIKPAATAQAVPITCTLINEYRTGKIRVQKDLADADNGGTSGNTTFDISYSITATNDGNESMSTGKLVDVPGFAPGLTIDQVRIASTKADLDNAATVTPSNGAYQLTTGVELAAGQSQTWWIRFRVTRKTTAPGYSEELLECSKDSVGRPVTGHGLFNEVNAENGHDYDGHDNNIVCGSVPSRSITLVKLGTQAQGTASAFTGVNGSPLYPLAGAQFALYDENPTPTSTPVATFTPDATGTTFTASGLSTGRTYWVVETKAPAGHALLPRPFTFTLESLSPGTGTNVVLGNETRDPSLWGATAIAAAASDSPQAIGGHATIAVTDVQVGTLPKSGSASLIMTLSGGLVLCLLSAGMLIAAQRRYERVEA